MSLAVHDLPADGVMGLSLPPPSLTTANGILTTPSKRSKTTIPPAASTPQQNAASSPSTPVQQHHSLQNRRNSASALHISPMHQQQASSGAVIATSLTASGTPMVVSSGAHSSLILTPPGSSATRAKPPIPPSSLTPTGTPSHQHRSIHQSPSQPIMPHASLSGGMPSPVSQTSPSLPTPPGTPTPLPVPKAPPGALTPSLGPDRTIQVTSARTGQIQRVNSREILSNVDSIEDVMLPPAASGDKDDDSVMTTASDVKGRSIQVHQTASQPSAPVQPVKHLVKLSSLSSLASLISIPNETPQSAPDGSPNSANIRSPSPSPPTQQMARSVSAPVQGSVPIIPSPPTYIVLDIDETIHVNLHNPCHMMCEKGLEMYQRIISTHANYRHFSYHAKSSLTKILQTALQAKRTVEEQTSDLLNSLQNASTFSSIAADGIPVSGGNNIKIFALTARFSHMAKTTRSELLKLNIDLEKSSPFPMSIRKKEHLRHQSANPASTMLSPSSSNTPSPSGSHGGTPLSSSPPAATGLTPSFTATSLNPPANKADAQEYYPDVSWQDLPCHGTDARYIQGVIYTNASEKGPVLHRFLEHLWTMIEEDNAEIMEQNEASKAAYLQSISNGNNFSHSATVPAGSSSTASTSSMDLIEDPESLHPASTRTASHPIQIHPPHGQHQAAHGQADHNNTPSPPDHSGSLSLLERGKQKHSHSHSHSSSLKIRKDFKSADHLQLPSPTALVDPHSDNNSTTSTSSSPVPPSPPVQLPISHLPTRLIFIDDRLQNCLSVYESLTPASLFDKFYNLPLHDRKRSHNHIPSTLEVYTCHYVPAELQHATPANSTQPASVQAAMAQAGGNHNDNPDFELIETQIHHFLTHGEILKDPEGHAMIKKIRSEHKEKSMSQTQQNQNQTQNHHQGSVGTSILQHMQSNHNKSSPSSSTSTPADLDTHMSDAHSHSHARNNNNAASNSMEDVLVK